MKIAVIGYLGKTGSKVYEVLKDNNYDVIGIDKSINNIEDVIDNIDLLIDFTNVTTALKNIFLCINHQKDFICASTGFTEKQLKEIKVLCNSRKINGVICYNFSLPINYLLRNFDFFNKYFDEMNYYDIHHVSKIDKMSGTTYLFLSKNNKIKIKSYKTYKNTITYVVQMISKYDKMIITYQVDDRKAFAIGLLSYIKGENKIVNLLE